MLSSLPNSEKILSVQYESNIAIGVQYAPGQQSSPSTVLLYAPDGGGRHGTDIALHSWSEDRLCKSIYQHSQRFYEHFCGFYTGPLEVDS